jgi:DNA-binding response OmpR family regulator
LQLKLGLIRSVDLMENLYEVVVNTENFADAAAQSIISHAVAHAAANRPRVRRGPGKYQDFWWADTCYSIRGKEFGVLRYTWRSSGRTARAIDLLEHVWESHCDLVGEKELALVVATVKRLRKKLANTPVEISFCRRSELVTITIV